MGTSLPQVDREVYDNSVMSTHQGCPRKMFYQYRLNRASAGKNFPIQFGISYHKFRDVLETHWLKMQDMEAAQLYYDDAVLAASEGWEDPPVGHKHEYLTLSRLRTTMADSFLKWREEKINARLVVIHTERPFDLELPSGRRFGGRIDQLLEWNGKLWLRDFKTTGRMGASYDARFDPNNQISGYVWALQILSGRPVEGAIIEVVYNTKLKGPEFHPFLATRSAFHIESWLETVENELNDIERHVAADVWPQRTDHCLHFGQCAFLEACQQSSWSAIDDWLESRTIESVWDFMNPDKEKGVTD